MAAKQAGREQEKGIRVLGDLPRAPTRKAGDPRVAKKAAGPRASTASSAKNFLEHVGLNNGLYLDEAT